MVDWDDAMEEARNELGYQEGEYVDNWDMLVDTARDWFDYLRQNEYEDFCVDAYHQHREYLQSDRWRKLRLQIIKRDNFICKDCGKKGVDVHHIDYQYLNTDEEKNFCVLLCRECHKKRHNIEDKKIKIKEEIKVFKKGLPCPICSKITELRQTMSGKQYLCLNYAYCGGRIK